MKNITKIKMTRHRNAEGAIEAVAFSLPDGMIIGSADHGGQSRFGEDPATIQVRFFLTLQHALDYTKAKCREYCGREDLDFLVEEGQPMVQSAGIQTQRRM